MRKSRAREVKPGQNSYLFDFPPSFLPKTSLLHLPWTLALHKGGCQLSTPEKPAGYMRGPFLLGSVLIKAQSSHMREAPSSPSKTKPPDSLCSALSYVEHSLRLDQSQGPCIPPTHTHMGTHTHTCPSILSFDPKQAVDFRGHKALQHSCKLTFLTKNWGSFGDIFFFLEIFKSPSKCRTTPLTLAQGITLPVSATPGGGLRMYQILNLRKKSPAPTCGERAIS